MTGFLALAELEWRQRAGSQECESPRALLASLAPVMMIDVPASGSFSRGTGERGDSEDGELVQKTHCLDILSWEGLLIHSLVPSSPA